MNNLQDRLNLLNDNQTMIASIAGVSKQAVTNWIFRNSIPMSRAKKLAKFYEVSIDWIEGGIGEEPRIIKDDSDHHINEKIDNEGNANLFGHIHTWDSTTPLGGDEVEVPFFMEVELAAGCGTDFGQENFGPKLRFSKSTLKKANVQYENAVVVKISGNSMEPRLCHGDVVGVDSGSTSIVDGNTYAINHDGLLRVKRLYREPKGGIRVNSLNTDEYADEVYNLSERESIIILGRVFWSSSMW